MITKMLTIGRLFTNCYIASCEQTNEALLIDPGFDDESEAETVCKYIDENSLLPKLILNTHGHPDHVCGNGFMKERFQTPILIHEYDAYMLGNRGRKIAGCFGFASASPGADVLLHDGDSVKFGLATLKVIHTPGHSHGSVLFLGEREAFTGDTLFAGSIGRTDFPESSEREMNLSLRKLAHLPDYLIVNPGHGPRTTMKNEKQSNPFLQELQS